MPEEIKFETIPLRFSGVFDLRLIYQTTKAWFPSVNAGVNWEKLYKDKVSGPGVREIEVTTQGFVKFDRYRKWDIEVTLKTWDTKEVTVNGKQLFSGRLEITIGGKLTLDYANMYGDKHASNFVKFLGKLLHQFTKKDEDFVIKKKIEQEFFKLQDQYKQILQMPV